MEETEHTLFTSLWHLKELATASHLLCSRDIEALEQLAQLNQTQQEADLLPRDDPAREAVKQRFDSLYFWLTRKYHYPVHRDEKTRLWRLGTELGKKDG